MIDVLLVDGDLQPFNAVATGVDLIAQRVTIRLRTWLGEWLLDASQGLPFFEWMQKKPPNATEIGARVRLEIDSTPGVVRTADFTSVFDPSARAITITCTIITADGELEAEISPLGTTMNRHPAVYMMARSGPLGR